MIDVDCEASAYTTLCPLDARQPKGRQVIKYIYTFLKSLA